MIGSTIGAAAAYFQPKRDSQTNAESLKIRIFHMILTLPAVRPARA